MRARMIHKATVQTQKFEPQENLGGYTWIFHLTDVDDFPSVLHAHNGDKPLRLDGNTGKIYDEGTRKQTGKIRNKELRLLHKNEKFIEFAQRRIREYNSKQPYKAIEFPSWLKVHPVMHRKQLQNDIETFCIYAKYEGGNNIL